jgi:hypothetical protein
VTITTGGVPDGIPFDPPKICEIMNRTIPIAQAPSRMTCTLLLRSIGNFDDRFAYGGGFEDFLDGSARCILFEQLAFQRHFAVLRRYRRVAV